MNNEELNEESQKQQKQVQEQKMKELENGNISVKFTCGGSLAIMFELFKWGTEVQIKKPVKLKESYKKYLTNVLNNVK